MTNQIKRYIDFFKVAKPNESVAKEKEGPSLKNIIIPHNGSKKILNAF